jgi:putative ABC transport system permease protein
MDDDLRQELDTHLALIEQEERASGLSAVEARQSARLRFGSPLAYRERALDAVIATWLENAWQDAIFAARQLRRRPGFTLSVVLLLAMGIGLNAGIFAIVNSVVLNALPLPDSGRLVVVTERTGTFETPTSWPDFLDLRDGSHLLESAAAFTGSSSVVFRQGTDARNVGGSYVTREYFATLGVQPLAGRLFDASEANAGKSVVLLREDFWRNALDGDPAIVGKAVVVNGKVSDVIGVLPRSFRFPADDNVLWMPLLPKGLEADRGWHAFSMVGRLKPAITLSQAIGDVDAVMQRLAHQFPEKNAGRRASVRRLQEWSLNGAIRDRLIVLQVAALVLCLVACANVSSLLLARYSARRLEFSIRAALGASRMRQMRQHVIESLLLTGLGCVTAVGFAWGAVRCLLWLYGARMPRAAEVSPDWRLVGVVVAVAMLVAVGLGVVTAVHQQTGKLETSIRESNRATGQLRAVHTRKILVVAQVACAVVLLSVTGEVLQKFWSLMHVDIGVDRSQLLTMQVNLPSEKYRAGADVAGFFERVADSVRTLPGVVNAAAINMLPVADWGFNGSVNVDGLPPSHPGYRGFFAEYRWITPEYFRTMGVIVTRGRLFLSEEISGKQKAAIINEAMARRLWGEKDPLGARVRFLSPEWITVVGVVRDVRQTGVSVPPSPEIFLPASVYTGPFPVWSLVVRSPLSTESLLPALRRAVKHEEQDAAIDRVKTMDEVVIDSVANQRIVTSLLLSFAVLALAMAALGIYSLVAYTVVARTPELAIRAALGSSPAALVRLVGRQGLALIAIGLALGAAATIPVSAALANSLFGVSRISAPVFAGVIVMLFAAGGLATLVPAAQTARIDPLRALRQE